MTIGNPDEFDRGASLREAYDRITRLPDFDPEADRQAASLLYQLNGIETPALRQEIAVRFIAEAHKTGVRRAITKVLDACSSFGPDRRQAGGRREREDRRT